MIMLSSKSYGRLATNRTNQTSRDDIEGARALLETFYYAFNQRDIDVFKNIWGNDEFVQLNNPLGGILRGIEPITNLYNGIFIGSSKVWVELSDIVEFQTKDMVVFAGREVGEFTKGENTISLNIRTTRIIQWFGEGVGWKQTHHHGSIDNSNLLAEYQQTLR
ncbi:MAG TPA: DUF4440 domain-containing protein, partial [Methylophilaceae bacterium]|nr:DUF4440 domain-containing protein [Methylophilaceae bacterium]